MPTEATSITKAELGKAASRIAERAEHRRPLAQVRFNFLTSIVRPPGHDADVPAFCRALGVPGPADVHVHFLPPRLLRRV